jgi:short-subunit dehydrogenase involved in D-alanine esterification of teichoic acids
MNQFHGKVSIITGGTSGIGRALKQDKKSLVYLNYLLFTPRHL